MVKVVLEFPFIDVAVVLKAATAFDAVGSLTQAQCQEVARTKLKEAIQSLTTALAAG